MPREKDAIHECFTERKDAHGKDKATCKYFGKIYAANTNRQRKHILHECNLVSALVSARYAVLGKSIPTAPASSTTSDHAEENFIVDNPLGMYHLSFLFSSALGDMEHTSQLCCLSGLPGSPVLRVVCPSQASCRALVVPYSHVDTSSLWRDRRSLPRPSPPPASARSGPIAPPRFPAE